VAALIIKVSASARTPSISFWTLKNHQVVVHIGLYIDVYIGTVSAS
jgi:hypothetical protein